MQGIWGLLWHRMLRSSSCCSKNMVFLVTADYCHFMLLQHWLLHPQKGSPLPSIRQAWVYCSLQQKPYHTTWPASAWLSQLWRLRNRSHFHCLPCSECAFLLQPGSSSSSSSSFIWAGHAGLTEKIEISAGEHWVLRINPTALWPLLTAFKTLTQLNSSDKTGGNKLEQMYKKRVDSEVFRKKNNWVGWLPMHLDPLRCLQNLNSNWDAQHRVTTAVTSVCGADNVNAVKCSAI